MADEEAYATEMEIRLKSWEGALEVDAKSGYSGSMRRFWDGKRSMWVSHIISWEPA